MAKIILAIIIIYLKIISIYSMGDGWQDEYLKHQVLGKRPRESADQQEQPLKQNNEQQQEQIQKQQKPLPILDRKGKYPETSEIGNRVINPSPNTQRYRLILPKPEPVASFNSFGQNQIEEQQQGLQAFLHLQKQNQIWEQQRLQQEQMHHPQLQPENAGFGQIGEGSANWHQPKEEQYLLGDFLNNNHKIVQQLQRQFPKQKQFLDSLAANGQLKQLKELARLRKILKKLYESLEVIQKYQKKTLRDIEAMEKIVENIQKLSDEINKLDPHGNWSNLLSTKIENLPVNIVS